MNKKHFLAYGGLVFIGLVISLAVITAGIEAATILSEGFEAGGKTSYAAGNVTLGTGSWYMNDALTGNSLSDRKSGSYSARVRNSGTVRMNFDVPSAAKFTVKHAKFGSDGTSKWELWRSTNGGSSWTKVGSTITTSSTSLKTASFTVNSGSPVRFELRKVSGGSNRINFDSISITNYTSSTPTPTPTPTATPTPTPTPPPSSSVHLTMGNPSNATTNVNTPLNYLMEKSTYALSYNNDDRRPNWVSWHLDSTWLGSTPRQDDFRADTTLPSGWYRVTGSDYSGSGYDRGHMCPSGDRTKTVSDNSSTFLMTNMIPQAPDNNQVTWASLETYCRTLAGQGNELYIISGGWGVSGYIGSGNVALPTYTWKVIIVLPSGSNDVSRVSTSTRTIAVLMPNQNDINSDWRTFRTSIDDIESLTGYDFLSNVPTSIQSVIESTVDSSFVADWEVTLDQYAIDEAKAERAYSEKGERPRK
ncbi:MAG: DNA/RNA endonuclease G, NUC1 [Acidobacteria bacterium OLB17]|nr:MAG: DNA/RNA endonuclease G, NUC1 [Acidobacteria bacterium OLB17]MCZ2389903.1 DNA/RNA non-specific endonuclease [Acidobacteriota bacterium]